MMPFLNLFVMFFRIGLFSFGGGYAMLPLIFQSVQEFGIMTSAEFSRLVALSQVTPGPIAVNAATYVGYKYAGFGGAVAATIGVALPSLILVLIVMHFIQKFEESKSLNAVLCGIRPATVGLIASAVIFLAENSIFNGPVLSAQLIENVKEYINLLPCVIFIGTIILAGKFNVGPIKLTILAGIAGALIIR
ncbi:MAG TPA: chromate transporter [Anaerovoracaceae bacterium]|nr:chromate transporter [Anaerovoracaceae bacterium]